MSLMGKFASAAKAVRYVKAEEKRLDEEKRRKAQLEREKRIQEELKKESQAQTGKLARASEKTKRLISQGGREVQLRKTRKVKLAAAFTEGVRQAATEDCKKQFSDLLTRYNVSEEDEDKNVEFKIRLDKIFRKLFLYYCDSHEGFDSDVQEKFLRAMESNNPSDFARSDSVAALASVLYEKPVDLEIPDGEEIQPVHKFIMQFVKILSARNKEATVDIFDALLEMFLPDSVHRRNYLHLLVYSDCWSPFNGLKMAHRCTNMTVDMGTKLVHKAKTYGVAFDKTYACLAEEDPMDALNKAVKADGDKSLDLVISEMRKAEVPEELLGKVEEIVSKILAKLPEVFHLDLSDNDILKCIEKVKELDMINPDVEKFVDAMVDMCIGVQDYTTIHVEGEKIEGFFPRVTQLVSVVMLLVSKTPELTGCVLEINTGEGKSCIVAMLSAILGIRGAHVDVISSSPMLARRDAEEWEPFFKMFHLAVGVAPTPIISELTPEQQMAKQREAYQCNIVYGTVGAFAADILRHEFEKVDVRGQRRCDAIVVDEIDYMTLDQGTQLTYLSHFATGMRHLEQLLAAIWNQVCSSRMYTHPDLDELWAVDRDNFHKTLHKILGRNSEENFHPLDIIRMAAKLGLISQDDVDKIGSSDEAFDSVQLKNLTASIRSEQQAKILNHIQQKLYGKLRFQKYTKSKDKKLNDFKLDGESSSSDENAIHTFRVLLNDNGSASELVTKEKLVAMTIKRLKQQIVYSTEAAAPSIDINNDQEPKIYMPVFMRDYVNNRLPVFVENALQAITMKKDREYMVYEDSERLKEGSSPNAENHHFDRIIPVDFKASGLLETNKQWGDGLQQFLEMKHQLSLSDMTTVTNFMSNFHFFKRYAQGLGVFGVTGTVGDEAGSTFMKKHFKVSCYPIPTHKRSKMIELPTIYVSDSTEVWLKVICDRVNEITNQTDHHTGQTVVIICEDIMTVELMEQKLINSGTVPAEHVHLYSRSDRHEVEGKVFMSNDVILTTALGARGTDFAVNDNVHASGGLFVLLTHLAPNRRVERQMFGRTARKGKPGMVQMILHRDHLEEQYQDQPVKQMRSRREEMERERIQEMEENELGPTDLREDLFDHFCKKLDNFCRQYSEEEKNLLAATPTKADEDLPDFVKKMNEKMDYEPAMNDLKETWADWLILNEKRIQDKPDQVEEMKKELDELIEKRTEELLSNKSDDFYDYVRQALARMHLYETMNRSTDCGTYDIWGKSIKTDPAYKAACLYNQAYIKLNQREGDNYVEDAIKLLEEASDAVQVFLAEAGNTVIFCFMAAEASGFKPHVKGDTNLIRQLETRMNLYNVWRQSINSTVRKLKHLQEQNEKRFQIKGTYIFGLVDNPDPWTEEELSKLFEIGLYKMFEVNSKPRYKASVVISVILAQLRVLCRAVVGAMRLGVTDGFSRQQLADIVSRMVDMVGVALSDTERQEWASIPAALYVAQKLRQNGQEGDYSEHLKNVIDELGESFQQRSRDLADREWSHIGDVTHSNVHSEDIGVLVQNLSNEEVILGINEVFNRMAAEKVIKIAMARKKLAKRVLRFITHKCVPAAVLEMSDPDVFEIPAVNRRKVTETILECCRDSISDSLTGPCKNNFKILIGLRSALENAVSSHRLVSKISLGVEVGLITDQLATNLAESILVQDLMEDIADLVNGTPHYRLDPRRDIPAVIYLRDKVLLDLEEEIRSQVVETCMAYITAIMDNFGSKVIFNKTV